LNHHFPGKSFRGTQDFTPRPGNRSLTFAALHFVWRWLVSGLKIGSMAEDPDEQKPESGEREGYGFGSIGRIGLRGNEQNLNLAISEVRVACCEVQSAGDIEIRSAATTAASGVTG
jgi:hypothetical protein